MQANQQIEPSPPERILWLWLASTGVILGHASVALWLFRDDLRLGHGNVLAIDSWTMLAVLPLLAFIFRHDRDVRDERHEMISARGVLFGHVGLVCILIVLLAYLAFAPPSARAFLTHFVLANMIVLLVLASYVITLLTQLLAYARDSMNHVPNDDFL